MKLKEYPISLYKTFTLSTTPLKKIQEKKPSSYPAIVSLTSIASRLHKVDITIRSLIMQSQTPYKIILWLPETLQNNIPKKLADLTGEVFEIRYSPYTFPHKKLIHTLELYPKHVIITCDDDFIYHREWYKLLVNAHLENPTSILANQTRWITYNEKGELLPYKEWVNFKRQSAKNTLPIGAAGVLYPPGSLDKKVFDVDLFLKLAPNADDLWFKAMATLKGTPCVQTKFPPPLIPIAGTQNESLKKLNVTKDKNREQWLALSNFFNFSF